MLLGWARHAPHRILWRFPIALGLVCVCLVVVLRAYKENPHANLVRSRNEIIAVDPPPVPAPHNAALDYMLAGNAYKNFTGGGRYPEDIQASSDVISWTNVASHLSANTKALAYIDEAVSKKSCKWQTNPATAAFEFSNISRPTRRATCLLAIRARSRAHAGDHLGAAKDIAALLTVAEHIGSMRLLINGMYEMNCRRTAMDTLQAIILNDMPTQAKDIEAYRGALSLQWDPFEKYGAVLTVETATIKLTSDCIASGDDSEFNNCYDSSGRESLSMLPHNLTYGLERRTSIELCQLAGSINSRRNAITKGELEAAGSLLWNSNLMHSLVDIQRSFIEQAERQRCAEVAMAVLLFRQNNGRDPKILSEVISPAPTGIFNTIELKLIQDEAPSEFAFGGNVFKTPPDTLRIYTVGADGIDSKGRNSRSGEKNLYTRFLDASFFMLAPIKQE